MVRHDFCRHPASQFVAGGYAFVYETEADARALEGGIERMDMRHKRGWVTGPSAWPVTVTVADYEEAERIYPAIILVM